MTEYQYEIEDKEVIINDNDPDLTPIHITLPNLCEWYSDQLGRPVERDEALTFVDGYGKAPEDQVFTHNVMPDKLKNIYEIVYDKLRFAKKYKDITFVTQEDIFEELEMSPMYYEDEIKWIKREIKRSFYTGAWVFIKGKPVYLPPPFYWFLNYWRLKNKNRRDSLPDYRDYQRVMFWAMYHAHTTDILIYSHRVVFNDEFGKLTERLFNEHQSLKDFENELRGRGLSFFNQLNITGGIVKRNPNGRTCNGINLISGRRIAKTDSAVCFGMWCTIRVPEQLFVIQALNKEQAVDKVFIRKIQSPFNKLPFFFRPYIRGREENRTGYSFLYDGDMSIAHRAGVVADPHGGRVIPLSSNERAADGEEVNFVYIDEPGKELDKRSVSKDIPSLWYEVLKPATEIGSEIVGTCVMPTTVGEMETGGGSQFLRIVNDSHYHERNDNGTTQSGLFNVFLSGYYAIPGFIDKWGYTVIENPKVPVISNTGKTLTIGAKQYHLNQAKYFERTHQWEKLNTHNRNYPPTFKAAFELNMKGMGMTEQTLQKMKSRVADLKFAKVPLTQKYDFRWIRDYESARTDLGENGLWTVAYLPPKQMWNLKTQVSEEDGYTRIGTTGAIYAPHSNVANKFIISFDPVKFDKMNTRGKKSSTPVAVVYYNRDESVDPDSKPREQWVSQDYVAFIAHRTDTREEIYEEVLKAAILYGAYIYPEANDANDFFQWIRRKGYDGYLLKDMDDAGKISPVPGVWADKNTINDMVLKTMSFFSQNVAYMKIVEIVEDWLKMRGIDDLTNHDIAAASGWCQRGSAQRTGAVLNEWHSTKEIEDAPDYF